MPIERIVASDPVVNSSVRSLAPAHASIARSLAGRVRYLYELATGAAAFADGGATPLNPQGRLGIDHSGPPWGSAFEHPIWISEGLPQISGATEVFGEAPVVDLGTQSRVVKVYAGFFVRPFQRIDKAPYSRAYLHVGATASGVGTATADVKIYDTSTPETNSAIRTTTISSSTTTVAVDLTSSIYTQVQPGYCERLIEFKLTSTVGMRIWYASLNQIVRRTH